MTSYLRGVGPRSQATVPQSQPLNNRQVKNNAGGYVYSITPWQRLDRFLILGSEKPTYYQGEQALTRENADSLIACVQQDGLQTVQRIVAVSEAGRAYKNDPALFALAVCAALGDDQTRAAAFAALPRVARIGTHLMHFLAFVEQFRGWGRGLRKGVANWYLSKGRGELAYHAVKYQSRDGWSQADALRLAHPRTDDPVRNAIFKWIVDGWDSVGEDPHPEDDLKIIWAFERAKRATSEHEIVELIREYNLPREAIPTTYLNSREVWRALLEDMPTTSLVRNLATLTRVGLLDRRTGEADYIDAVISQLTDAAILRRARVHPIQVLAALKTYTLGRGVRGNNTWDVNQDIANALDRAFYMTFSNVIPTGKRYLVGLDVSGSMGVGSIAGVPGLVPSEGAAAMALLLANTEKDHYIVGFANSVRPLPIRAGMRLDDAVRVTSGMTFGSTDASAAIKFAESKNLAIDCFVVITDNETWAGRVHPAKAIADYRHKTGISDAKVVVIGMTATGFSIADPNDAGMLDVVGFDTAVPEIVREFALGNI